DGGPAARARIPHASAAPAQGAGAQRLPRPARTAGAPRPAGHAQRGPADGPRNGGAAPRPDTIRLAAAPRAPAEPLALSRRRRAVLRRYFRALPARAAVRPRPMKTPPVTKRSQRR